MNLGQKSEPDRGWKARRYLGEQPGGVCPRRNGRRPQGTYAPWASEQWGGQCVEQRVWEGGGRRWHGLGTVQTGGPGSGPRGHAVVPGGFPRHSMKAVSAPAFQNLLPAPGNLTSEGRGMFTEPSTSSIPRHCILTAAWDIKIIPISWLRNWFRDAKCLIQGGTTRMCVWIWIRNQDFFPNHPYHCWLTGNMTQDLCTLRLGSFTWNKQAKNMTHFSQIQLWAGVGVGRWWERSDQKPNQNRKERGIWEPSTVGQHRAKCQETLTVGGCFILIQNWKISKCLPMRINYTGIAICSKRKQTLKFFFVNWCRYIHSIYISIK